MEEERWVPIKGYEPFYEVSSLGRVRSDGRIRTNYCAKPRILKPNPHPNRYLQVVLFKKGKPLTKKVHRLVAEAFIPNPKQLPEVNHKNGIRDDNRVKNLEWMTHAQNKRHAKSLKSYGLKLRAPDVVKIQRRLDSGEDPIAIAPDFDVTAEAIKSIKYGYSWSHITGIQRRLPRR